jgi:hypothetical protein
MKQLLFLFVIFFLACSEEKKLSPLDAVLKSEKPAIKNVMDNLKAHEVQIIYTKIDKNSDGKTILTDYSFQVDATNYFYPASTVKLPAAVLALEYIDAYENLSAVSAYTIDGDTVVHSIKDDVRQVFSVSDNEAYNRLYELLGSDFINKSLESKGMDTVRISHRLATSEVDKIQRDTLHFEGGIKLIGTLDNPMREVKLKSTSKGIGYMRNDSLISEPMDFSEKNYFPLKTQHDLLKRIFFPDYFSINERFHLSESSLDLLKTSMHTVPRKVGYDEAEYYDSYTKFFIYGNSRGRIQDHIKIYNKAGYAYGTLTDTALIIDEKKNVRFLLSATILVNKNEIFNDDLYEYEAIGLQFLTELGRELYHYELARTKQ